MDGEGDLPAGEGTRGSGCLGKVSGGKYAVWVEPTFGWVGGMGRGW